MIRALRDKLDKPELIERFAQMFKQRTAALRSQTASATEKVDRPLRDAERRIANLTDSMARVGW